MRLAWTAQAWSDYLEWHADDGDLFARINALLKEAMRTPFSGMGKPEPLRGDLAGYWSRRIDREHRLVYAVQCKGEEQTLVVVSCRYHYGR